MDDVGVGEKRFWNDDLMLARSSNGGTVVGDGEVDPDAKDGANAAVIW